MLLYAGLLRVGSSVVRCGTKPTARKASWMRSRAVGSKRCTEKETQQGEGCYVEEGVSARVHLLQVLSYKCRSTHVSGG